VTRLTAVVLALAAFALLALAQPFPFDFNTYRQWDVGDVPAGDGYMVWNDHPLPFAPGIESIVPRNVNPRWCGELLVGPPGHQEKALPYAELWAFGRMTGAGTPGAIVAWRWRTWYPGDYSRIYHGPWTPILYAVTSGVWVYAPIWGGDTLGWFNDIEFAASPGATNDTSSHLTVKVVRRTWK
jgi:hypothetical protein